MEMNFLPLKRFTFYNRNRTLRGIPESVALWAGWAHYAGQPQGSGTAADATAVQCGPALYHNTKLMSLHTTLVQYWETGTPPAAPPQL